MGKSQIEAFTKAQMKSLVAKDNKERLKFTVAGCKDGHLYSHDGTDFGLYEADAPDTEFITQADLEVGRLTSSRLEKIYTLAETFFNTYGSASKETSEDVPKKPSEQPVSVENSEDTPSEDEVDNEALVKACKKAIKKEDFKKAQKLIEKLTDEDAAKKLSKKLKKATK